MDQGLPNGAQRDGAKIGLNCPSIAECQTRLRRPLGRRVELAGKQLADRGIQRDGGLQIEQLLSALGADLVAIAPIER
jgi:hypothetical protein